MENAERKQIAETILSQLGGKRFVIMTGAKDIAFGPNGELQFKLPKGTKNKANYVKIALDFGTDTYTMTFLKTLSTNEICKRIQEKRNDLIDTVKTVDMVYCDMLQDVFTSNTGLYTSL
jgi:hypothetical protein